jgi:toxin ParE1/3/4
VEYRVELTRRAERDLIALFDRINAGESEAAARWFQELERRIEDLATFPRRCPKAPESKTAGRPLRQLLFGSKPYVYRVIYEIDERSRAVYVLTIRHGFMREAQPIDLT